MAQETASIAPFGRSHDTSGSYSSRQPARIRRPTICRIASRSSQFCGYGLWNPAEVGDHVELGLPDAPTSRTSGPIAASPAAFYPAGWTTDRIALGVMFGVDDPDDLEGPETVCGLEKPSSHRAAEVRRSPHGSERRSVLGQGERLAAAYRVMAGACGLDRWRRREKADRRNRQASENRNSPLPAIDVGFDPHNDPTLAASYLRRPPSHRPSLAMCRRCRGAGAEVAEKPAGNPVERFDAGSEGAAVSLGGYGDGDARLAVS